MQQPILPITDADDEWTWVADDRTNGKVVYQNKRCSAVFKEDDKTYYLDAIIFRAQNGSCFTGNSVKFENGDTLRSRQYIKFPFKPKSFYIDVIETEWADAEQTEKLNGGGWWTYVLKDESQLEEVFKYYIKG